MNKPRVFFSHSKKDIDFIEKLNSDLNKCQIDTWIDTNDIRHGEPWLNEIFDNGIPTCDSIIIYLTEFSIESQMVKKEIDAGILQKLKDNGVSFLPYVSDKAIRDKLRLDLQALQTPEWNNKNYLELLPRVVSEIWRGYLEKTISTAVNSEKVKRLEFQLELEKIKIQSSSIFSQAEEKDLQYIYNHFNSDFDFSVKVYQDIQNGDTKKSERTFYGETQFKLSIISLFSSLSNSGTYDFYDSIIESILQAYFKKHRDIISEKGNILISNYPKISDSLLMFGLLTRVANTPSNNIHPLLSKFESKFKLVFTEKMERFKYWLNYKNLLCEELKIQ